MRIAILIAVAALVGSACSKSDDKKTDEAEEASGDEEAAGDEPAADEKAAADEPAADEETAADEPAEDEEAAADKPVEKATSAHGSIEEFKAWADELCACENPACLDEKIAGFKKLFDKYGHLQGAEAEAIGEKAGVHAGRGMNCFVEGGGDQAKLQEVMQMLQ